MRDMLEKSAATSSHVRPESTTPNNKLVLTRFVEGDDIEAFLTTFECLMAVYHVEETRWVAKLAPQLSGRAQQAYAAMSARDPLEYAEVKKSILRSYNINEETYRQRFRTAR